MEKFKLFRFFIPAVIIFALLLSACGGRQDRESRTVTEDRERTAAAIRAIEGLEDYPIPTSVEVVDMLQRAGAAYVLGISNSPANVDRYFTEYSKALNLGVYGADLSYAATYEMHQEIRRYLQVSKQLIDELNISTTFNQDFVNRVERNLDNKDSLINIVSESVYDTYIFLTEQRRDDLALLVMTGSWIEGLYLTSQLAIGARDNTEITDIILAQDEPLEKLLELLDDHEEDPFIHGFYQDLKEIYEFIKGIESPMSSRQLDAFADKIEVLRTRVIS